MAEASPRYRLVIFDEVDEPEGVRDLLCKVTGQHPTDAMQWVSRAPGTWPRPLDEQQTRALLDGLYIYGVAAEAWRVDLFPELSPARSVHSGACTADGFRVLGLRGETTHWIPWPKVELLSVGRISAEDEYRHVSPPGWASAVSDGLGALVGRAPRAIRKNRAMRIPRDPTGEIILVRSDPRLAFRIAEAEMNYAYLGDRLRPSAAENFPMLVAEMYARADGAYITPATRSFLEKREPSEHDFPNSQALLDYTTNQLLWSWYRRDRDSQSTDATNP
ncbi:hypothetical protein EP7_001592 [Isosphaeraceae bacterium EP7]